MEIIFQTQIVYIGTYHFTDCPDQNINIQSTYVKKVTFGESSTTCRMVAYLNSNYKGTINKISKTKTKITLIKNQKKK